MNSEFQARISAFKHPQYLRFWLGSLASVGATQLQMMGSAWLIYELSGSALYLGYLGAAASIPTIIVSLFGGALADRLDKRLILMVTSILVGTLLLLLAILDLFELVRVWHVLVITSLIALTSGFDWPTRQAIFPSLIDQEDMMSAIALNSIIWQGSRMIMPAIGGLIIAISDTWLVFLCSSIGFFLMFVVIAGLKVKVSQPALVAASTLQQIRAGLAFVVYHRLFMVLIPLTYAGSFFCLAYMQILPALTADLGTDSTGYGYLLSATGLGSLVGTLVVGSFQNSRQLGMIMLGSAALAGLSLYGFGLAAGFGRELDGAFEFAIAAAFAISFFNSIYMIMSMTILQMKVPDNFRGRVMSIHSITYSLMSLGGLLAGVLATLMSPPEAIWILATVYLIIVFGIIITQGQIRQIDGRRIAFS